MLKAVELQKVIKNNAFNICITRSSFLIDALSLFASDLLQPSQHIQTDYSERSILVYYSSLRVGDDGANISQTHDKKRDGLWKNIEAEFALSIVEIIAGTSKEYAAIPSSGRRSLVEKNSLLQVRTNPH